MGDRRWLPVAGRGGCTPLEINYLGCFTRFPLSVNFFRFFVQFLCVCNLLFFNML